MSKSVKRMHCEWGCSFALSLILLLFLSCQSFKRNTEQYWMDVSKFQLKREVAILQNLDICDYQFKQNNPQVKSLEPGDFLLSSLKDYKIDGFYDSNSKTIYYNKNKMGQTLVHEMYHFLSWEGVHGRVTNQCIEETAALLFDRVVHLEIDNQKLNQELRMRTPR